MSQRIIRAKQRKRRLFTYLWISALAVSVFLLIYFEQIALLYILATLGVTVLLIIVALADLGRGDFSAETAPLIPEPSIRPPESKSRK
jgi:hypothetical protein